MKITNIAGVTFEFEIEFRDVCLPDYFQGCSFENREVFAISVRRDTTMEQAKKCLADEFRGSWNEDIPACFEESEFKLLLDAEFPDTRFVNTEWSRALQYIELTEEDEHNGEEVYAYFILSWRTLA